MLNHVYWYISKAKLDILKESAPAFFEGVSVKLGFKLPFISGSLSGTNQSTLIKDLKRVVAKLESSEALKGYDELASNEAPIMFRFQP